MRSARLFLLALLFPFSLFASSYSSDTFVTVPKVTDANSLYKPMYPPIGDGNRDTLPIKPWISMPESSVAEFQFTIDNSGNRDNTTVYLFLRLSWSATTTTNTPDYLALAIGPRQTYLNQVLLNSSNQVISGYRGVIKHNTRRLEQKIIVRFQERNIRLFEVLDDGSEQQIITADQNDIKSGVVNEFTVPNYGTISYNGYSFAAGKYAPRLKDFGVKAAEQIYADRLAALTAQLANDYSSDAIAAMDRSKLDSFNSDTLATTSGYTQLLADTAEFTSLADARAQLTTTFEAIKPAIDQRIKDINTAWSTFATRTGASGDFSTSGLKARSYAQIDALKVAGAVEAELEVAALRDYLKGMPDFLYEVDITLERIQNDLAPLGLTVISSSLAGKFRITQQLQSPNNTEVIYTLLSSTDDTVGYRVTLETGNNPSSGEKTAYIYFGKKIDGEWDDDIADTFEYSMSSTPLFANSALKQWLQNNQPLPVWIEYNNGALSIGLQGSEHAATWSYLDSDAPILDRYVIDASGVTVTQAAATQAIPTQRTFSYLASAYDNHQQTFVPLPEEDKFLLTFNTTPGDGRYSFYLHSTDRQTPNAHIEIYDTNMSVIFTDFVEDAEFMPAHDTFEFMKDTFSSEYYNSDLGYVTRRAYNVEFENISSYWIAYDNGTYSLGVNEVIPENAVIAGTAPRTFSEPLSHLSFWTQGNSTGNTVLSYNMQPLGDVDVKTHIATLPPLGYSRDSKTGVVSIHGGTAAAHEPVTRTWKETLEVSTPGSFFVEIDPYKNDLSTSFYVTLEASELNTARALTIKKPFLSALFGTKTFNITVTLPEKGIRYLFYQRNLSGDVNAPYRLEVADNTIKVQRYLYGAWQTQKGRIVVSQQDAKGLWQTVSNDTTAQEQLKLDHSLNTIRYLGANTIATLQLDNFRYTGMSLHDQVMTPENTGTYLWDTGAIGAQANNIHLQGTLVHTNTTEGTCAATIGLAPLNGDVTYNLIISATGNETGEAGRIYIEKPGQTEKTEELVVSADTPLGTQLRNWYNGTPLPFWIDYQKTSDAVGALSLGFDTTFTKTPVWSYLDTAAPSELQEVGLGTINTSLTYQQVRIVSADTTLGTKKRTAAENYFRFLSQVTNTATPLTIDQNTLNTELTNATLVSQVQNVTALAAQRNATLYGRALQELQRITSKAVTLITTQIPNATTTTELSTLILDPVTDIQNSKDILEMAQLYTLDGVTWTTEQQALITAFESDLATLKLTLATDGAQPTISLVDTLARTVDAAITSQQEMLEDAANTSFTQYQTTMNERIAEVDAAPSEATLTEIENRTPTAATLLAQTLSILSDAGLSSDERVTKANNLDAQLTQEIATQRDELIFAQAQLTAFNTAAAAYTDTAINNFTKNQLIETTDTVLADILKTETVLDALTVVNRTQDKRAVAKTRDTILANIKARLTLITTFETELGALENEKTRRIATFDGMSAATLTQQIFTAEDLQAARTACTAAYSGTVIPTPHPVDAIEQELRDEIEKRTGTLTSNATELYTTLSTEVATREAALTSSLLFIKDMPSATFDTRTQTTEALATAGMTEELATLSAALTTYATNHTQKTNAIILRARTFYDALITQASERYTQATQADAATTSVQELPSDIFDFPSDPANPEPGTEFTNIPELLARRTSNAAGVLSDYATTLVAILNDANLAIPREHDPNDPNNTKFNTAAINAAIDRAYNAISLKRAAITGNAEELRDGILEEYAKRQERINSLYAAPTPGQTGPTDLDYARLLLAPSDANVLSLNNVDVLTLATPLATTEELVQIETALRNANTPDVSLPTGEVITAFEQVSRAVNDIATQYVTIRQSLQTHAISLLTTLINEAISRIGTTSDLITSGQVRTALETGADTVISTLSEHIIKRIASATPRTKVTNLPQNFDTLPAPQGSRDQINFALQNADLINTGPNEQGEVTRIVDLGQNAVLTYNRSETTRLTQNATTQLGTLRSAIDTYLTTLSALDVAQLLARQDQTFEQSIDVVAAIEIEAARTAHTDAGISDTPVDDELDRVSQKLVTLISAQETSALDAWKIFETEASARIIQANNAVSVEGLPSDQFINLASTEYPTATAVRDALASANLLILSDPEDTNSDQVSRKINDLQAAIQQKENDLITLANSALTTLVGQVNTLEATVPNLMTAAEIDALDLPTEAVRTAAEDAFDNAGLGIDKLDVDFDSGKVTAQITRAENLKQTRKDALVTAAEQTAFDAIVTQRIASAEKANNIFPLDHAYNAPANRFGQPPSILDTPPHSIASQAGPTVSAESITDADQQIKTAIETKHTELKLLAQAAWQNLSSRFVSDQAAITSFTTKAGVESYNATPFNDIVAAARVAYDNIDQSHTTDGQNIEAMVAARDQWYNNYLILRTIEDEIALLTGSTGLTQRAINALNNEALTDSTILDAIKTKRNSLNSTDEAVIALVDAMNSFEAKVEAVEALFTPVQNNDIIITELERDPTSNRLLILVQKEREVELARLARYSTLSENEAIGAALAKLSALKTETVTRIEAINPPGDTTSGLTQAELDAIATTLVSEEETLTQRHQTDGDIARLRIELTDLSLETEDLDVVVTDIEKAINNRRIALARHAMALLNQRKEALVRPVHTDVITAVDSDPSAATLTLAQRTARFISESKARSLPAPGMIDTTVTLTELDEILNGDLRTQLQAQISATIKLIEALTLTTDSTLTVANAQAVDALVVQKIELRRGILQKDAAAYELARLDDAQKTVMAAIVAAQTGDELNALSQAGGAVTTFVAEVSATKTRLSALTSQTDSDEHRANLAAADEKEAAVMQRIPLRADEIAQTALSTLNQDANSEEADINQISDESTLPDEAALRRTLAEQITAYTLAKTLAGTTTPEAITQTTNDVITHLLGVVQLRRTYLSKNATLTEYNILTTATGPSLQADIKNTKSETELQQLEERITLFIESAERVATELRAYNNDELTEKAALLEQWIIDITTVQESQLDSFVAAQRTALLAEYTAALNEINTHIISMPAIMHAPTLEQITLSFDSAALTTQLASFDLSDEITKLTQEVAEFTAKKAWHLAQLESMISPEETAPPQPKEPSGDAATTATYNLGRLNSFYALFNDHSDQFSLSFSYVDKNNISTTTPYILTIPRINQSATLSHTDRVLTPATPAPPRVATEQVFNMTTYLLYVTPVPNSSDCLWHLLYHRGIYLSKTGADGTPLPTGTYRKVRRDGSERPGDERFVPTSEEHKARIEKAFTKISNDELPGLRYVPVWSTLFMALDRKFGDHVGALETITFTYS